MTQANVYKEAYNAIRDMANEGMEGNGQIKSYFDDMDEVIQKAEELEKTEVANTQEETPQLSRGAELANVHNERDQQQQSLKDIWGE